MQFGDVQGAGTIGTYTRYHKNRRRAGKSKREREKEKKKGSPGETKFGRRREKRRPCAFSEQKKKTGGGCCEKEGASFVVRRGREADVGVWIGQCRPLSISDSVPSTTQAGQSESELCRGTVTTFHLPARSRFGWRYGGSRPSPVPLSQADCFVSAASVSRTKTRISVGAAPPGRLLLVPTPTLTDELVRAVSCL